MKNFFFLFVSLLIFGACKPKIIYMSMVPDKFCGCSQIDVFYDIKKAKSATISASPGDFPETALNLAETGSAVDSFCETTTITIRAKNSNGTVSASRVVTRVDPPAPNIQRMVPCSGLNWVNVLSGTDYPAENSVITTIEFSADRDGVLSAFGVVAEVHAGPNVLNEFAGLRVPDEIVFAAPLKPNETCIGSSTAPDGRVRPPEFSIKFNLRCSH